MYSGCCDVEGQFSGAKFAGESLRCVHHAPGTKAGYQSAEKDSGKGGERNRTHPPKHFPCCETKTKKVDSVMRLCALSARASCGGEWKSCATRA